MSEKYEFISAADYVEKAYGIKLKQISERIFKPSTTNRKKKYIVMPRGCGSLKTILAMLLYGNNTV